MILVKHIALAGVLAIAVGAAHAQGAPSPDELEFCYLLGGDAKSECLAEKHKNVGMCSAIQNADVRTSCRARVTKDLSICGGVQDPTLRTRCLTMP